MAKMTMKLERIVLNDSGIQAFLTDDGLRSVLIGPADEIRAAIPNSDGPPAAPRKKGERATNGRYQSKFTDRQANALDGRVAVDTGVEYADRFFFSHMTLQRAIRSIGGKLKRKKGGR